MGGRLYLPPRTTSLMAARAAAASPWKAGFTTAALISSVESSPSPLRSHWRKYWLTTSENFGGGVAFTDAAWALVFAGLVESANDAQPASSTSAQKSFFIGQGHFISFEPRIRD